MLTGRRAFEGKSQAGLIGAIMHAEPVPISATQPLTPPALDRIVKNSLAKDPDDRWQSARDLSTALQWIGHDSGAVAVVKHKGGLAWAVATLLGIALAVVGIRQVSRQEPNLPVAKFTVAAPAGTSFLPPSGQPWSASISPDGTRIVFQVERDGERMLAVRSIDGLESLESQIIPGTERGRFPFWSPDSRDIAFFSDGKLKRINTAGGSLQTICEVAFGLGGSWNPEGVIVFSAAEGLYQVSAAAPGGTPRLLISSQDGGKFNFRPQFLPDGRRFLYGTAPDNVYLASLAGGAPRRVLTGAPMALYAPTGHLLFYRDSTLLAQRFDSNLSGPISDPVAIAEGITGPLCCGGAAFSVSDNGVLAYKTFPSSTRRLQLFDRTGHAVDTIGPLPFEDFGAAELSHDGTQIAMHSSSVPDETAHIWLFDLTQRQPRQLTFAAGVYFRPIWSPDGRRLVFASRRAGESGLYQKSLGGEPAELVLPSPTDGREYRATDWSLNGIVYESRGEGFDVDLWILPIDGDRKPYPVVGDPGVQGEGKMSPNGRWLAYTEGDRRGRQEVFVRRLATGEKWKISTAGGKFARWRDDGKELFYLAADGNLIAVPVETNAANFRYGVSETLFQTGLSFREQAFSVSKDGRQFLMPVADDGASSIVVFINWLATLNP
jgi:Tol biopolymer transport system component